MTLHNSDILAIESYPLLPKLAAMNANERGELLRDLIFDQSPDSRGEWDFGCYSTFELYPWCYKISDRSIINSEWKAYDEIFYPWVENLGSGAAFACQDAVVTAIWHWNGEGLLVFKVKDFADEMLYQMENEDCKKDYRWKAVG